MTRHFTAAANKREGHTHVLLITTGSVASVKAPLIVEELLKVPYSFAPHASVRSAPVHAPPRPIPSIHVTSRRVAPCCEPLFSFSTRTYRCKSQRPTRRSPFSSRRIYAGRE